MCAPPGTYNEGVGRAHGVEAEVEGPELVVDGRVEHPVEVQTHVLLAIRVGDGDLVATLLERERLDGTELLDGGLEKR